MSTNHAPIESANARITPPSFNALPSRTSPPYQMNMSHAVFSDFTSSHVKTPVSNNAAAPSSAVTVMSTPCRPAVAHIPHTPANTNASIRSCRDIGPIFNNSRAANAAASGVFVISGGNSFITSSGITASDTIPGTDPATNQLIQVIGNPFCPAICAAIGLLACPVKNIAAPMQTLWYTATIRYAPNFLAVGPGVDPYSSAIDRAIGSVTPPDRAPFDGIIVANNASVVASAYVIPTDVVPNIRTKINAIRRASPVFNNAREIRNAVNTSHTIGSEYPDNAFCIVNPPTTAEHTTPINTIAPPATGCRISPNTVAAKIPKSCHASCFTAAGFGSP